jgi:AraC-like DNA-binding protein
MRQCASELEQVLGEGYRGNSIVARVKRNLVEHPQSCNFSLEGTAQLLKIHPRSLRRYLAESNTNFRHVCLTVRMELAQQYLRHTNMPLKAIAYQLSYRHANNFNRAYSDYYGEPPNELRQRHQAASAVS